MKQAKHIFMTVNIDADDKPGIHWWSFLDLPKKDSKCMFDSYDTLGLSTYIV